MLNVTGVHRNHARRTLQRGEMVKHHFSSDASEMQVLWGVGLVVTRIHKTDDFLPDCMSVMVVARIMLRDWLVSWRGRNGSKDPYTPCRCRLSANPNGTERVFFMVIYGTTTIDIWRNRPSVIYGSPIFLPLNQERRTCHQRASSCPESIHDQSRLHLTPVDLVYWVKPFTGKRPATRDT